jgi:hypothetical protein
MSRSAMLVDWELFCDVVLFLKARWWTYEGWIESLLDIEIGRGFGGAAPVTSQLPRCTNQHASPFSIFTTCHDILTLGPGSSD